MKKERIYDNDQLDAMKAKASADCLQRVVRRQLRVAIVWKKHRNSKGVTENYEGDVKQEIHKTKVATMLRDLARQIEQREAKDGNKVFADAITVNIYAA